MHHNGIPPSEHLLQQLNSCLDFIRPPSPDSLTRKHKLEATFLANSKPHIACSATLKPINDNSSRILLQINTDPLRISYSSPVHDDRLDDTIFYQLKFPHLKRPLASQTPSDTSSSSPSPALEQKSVATCLTDKSPAASFLANFVSTVVNNSNLNSTQPSKETIIDDYNLGETIGYGGFSIVRKAHHVYTGKVVAVKIVQHQLVNELSFTRLDRELSIWRSLDHPNIVCLQKAIHVQHQGVSYLINDYCSGGNLLNYLNTCKQMEESKAKRVFRELCQGVRYLHVDRHICHKDLKLENILLDKSGHVKICDFGLAIEMPQQHTTASMINSSYSKAMHHRHSHKKSKKQDENQVEELAGGSLAYAAPEQIRQRTPLMCPKTDIWSLGVILYTLIVGSLPFRDDYDLRLQQKILEGHFEIPTETTTVLSDSLQELIYACLTYEPDKRLNINQVLKSEWLNTW